MSHQSRSRQHRPRSPRGSPGEDVGDAPLLAPGSRKKRGRGGSNRQTMPHGEVYIGQNGEVNKRSRHDP